MAVVDHDMRFVYVHAGWEGSAHDARVFFDAILRPELQFPCPHNKDKYYLVDSGYPHQPGFMAPYKGERYHKSQWRGNYNFNRLRELFNHRHSSIRNVVERTFGVLKQRFPILKEGMPPYKPTRQVDLVIAYCVVHNIIRDNDMWDNVFERFQDETVQISTAAESRNTSEQPNTLPSIQENSNLRQWSARRDEIAEEMWMAYVG